MHKLSCQQSPPLAKQINVQVAIRSDDLTPMNDVDILKLIFLNLSPRDLTRVALVCKLFKEPSLDILWSSLDSLVPLFNLLRPFRLVNDIHAFRGPFDENAWSTFDANAGRVRRLTLTPNTDKKGIAYTTIERLSWRRPYFFPNLTDLTCCSVIPARTPLLSLISPHLENLELDGNETAYENVIEPVISKILYESGVPQRNNLKRLVLHGDLPATLLGSLCRFSNLSKLYIAKPVTFEFFESVGRLESLEDLTIILPKSDEFPSLNLGFERLQILNITSPLPPLFMIFEKMSTTQLISISITIARLPLPKHTRASSITKDPLSDEADQAFRECLRALNACSGSSLKSIILDQSEYLQKANPLHLARAFVHLCFIKLEHLQFSHPKFSYNDKSIHILVLACPNLRKLYLPLDRSKESTKLNSTSKTGAESNPSPTTTTIVSLWALAEACPNLTHLQLYLDTDTIPPFPDGKIGRHKLTSLLISTYPSSEFGLACTFQVARHIFRLFPHVTITGHSNHNPKLSEEINDAVNAFKMVAMDVEARRLKYLLSDDKDAGSPSH